MGGTYAFVRAASANLREKDDPWNTALAGFSSGALLGLRGAFSPNLFEAVKLSWPSTGMIILILVSFQPAPSPLFSVTVLPLPLPWPLSITPKDFSDIPKTRRRMNSSAARNCARLTRLLLSRPLRNWARDVVRRDPHPCLRGPKYYYHPGLNELANISNFCRDPRS